MFGPQSLKYLLPIPYRKKETKQTTTKKKNSCQPLIQRDKLTSIWEVMTMVIRAKMWESCSSIADSKDQERLKKNLNGDLKMKKQQPDTGREKVIQGQVTHESRKAREHVSLRKLKLQQVNMASRRRRWGVRMKDDAKGKIRTQISKVPLYQPKKF